jgi:hypothetical protein
MTGVEKVKHVSLVQLGREIPLVTFTMSLKFQLNTDPSPNKTQNIICNSCSDHKKKAIYITTVHTVVICNYLLIHCLCASPCSAEDNTDTPQSTEASEMLTKVLTKRNL